MVTAQFDRVAQSVTERAAELLCAPVSVIDERGVVVASSEPRLVGVPFELGRAGGAEYLRVPIRLDARADYVVVA